MASNLYQKIIAIYPALTNLDFGTAGTIWLQNDSNGTPGQDGLGNYIKSWNNSIYSQPTQAQLDAIN